MEGGWHYVLGGYLAFPIEHAQVRMRFRCKILDHHGQVICGTLNLPSRAGSHRKASLYSIKAGI